MILLVHAIQSKEQIRGVSLCRRPFRQFTIFSSHTRNVVFFSGDRWHPLLLFIRDIVNCIGFHQIFSRSQRPKLHTKRVEKTEKNNIKLMQQFSVRGQNKFDRRSIQFNDFFQFFLFFLSFTRLFNVNQKSM